MTKLRTFQPVADAAKSASARQPNCVAGRGDAACFPGSGRSHVKSPRSKSGALLHERGIDVSHEAARYWWHRFGPMFASEIRNPRIEGMKFGRRRLHLDELFVKVIGEP
jgi:hypothetical protein